MDKEQILKAFKPDEKIILIGEVGIGSAIHHTIIELRKAGRSVVVVSDETQARREIGLVDIPPINREYIIEAPIPIPSYKYYDTKVTSPIDAIAKKRKY